MSDDIVARLRVWIDQASQQGVEEAVKGLTMAADTIERLDAKAFALEYENELLRAEVERLRAGGCARDQTTTQFCAEAERLRSERDEARRQTRRILNEIDCRIEHGAESNGHLEAIRNLFEEATDER